MQITPGSRKGGFVMQHFWRVLWLAMLSVMCMGEVLANGKLSHLSGSVTVQKADGSKTAASPGAVVGSGDTVLTGANGFARLETPDGGEIVLRPNSEFVVEKLHFDQAKPEEDSFVYNMVKGGLRTVTGLIGKRGNKDAYVGKTPTSTIGIRGTLFEVRVCGCEGMPNGTYLSVRNGSVNVRNANGTITTTPGAAAFVFVPAGGGAPQVLAKDPNIGFTPPPAVPQSTEQSSSPANNGTPGGAEGGPNCTIEAG